MYTPKVIDFTWRVGWVGWSIHTYECGKKLFVALAGWYTR